MIENEILKKKKFPAKNQAIWNVANDKFNAHVDPLSETQMLIKYVLVIDNIDAQKSAIFN